MKKKIRIVILIFFMLFVTACKNPVDSVIKDAKKEVSSNIKNVSKEKVKESVVYIHDNYEKKIDKKFIYHTLFLQKIAKNQYLDGSNMERLSEASYEYMLRQSKGNKEELEECLDIVYKNLDEETNQLYESYQRSVTVTKYLAKAKTKLIVEKEETNFISSEKINKAIDYIRDYYDNAFKNNEVIDNLSYYSMYLENVGSKVKKNNNIIKLGKGMKKYLQEGREKKLEEVGNLITEIESNREALIGELIN